MLSDAALDPAPRAARRGDCSAPMCGHKMLQLKMTPRSECEVLVRRVDEEGTIYIKLFAPREMVLAENE